MKKYTITEKEYREMVEGINTLTSENQKLRGFIDGMREQLIIGGVVSSCVDKETLIEDLDDKRIVGVTLDENMWHYCRKETAEHLLDKYEIKTK